MGARTPPLLALVLLTACSASSRTPAASRPPPPRAAPAVPPAPQANRTQAAPQEPTTGTEPPAAAAPRFLKGETHVHTSGSYDAHTPPEEVLAFYAARGYDFVALTDHNHVTVARPPAGMLVIPGVEYTQNASECTPPPHPGYRCLFHTTGLFVDPARDPAHGERFTMPFQRGRLDAFEEQIRAARQLGGIAVVNHPQFHWAADARLIETLAGEGVKLVEFFNASLESQHPAGKEDAERRAEQLWDQVLGDGVLVYAMATDDAHHFSDAESRHRHGKFAYVGDRAWIMVRADKTLASIRAALLAGDFYCSTGVMLSALAVSRGDISLTVTGAAAVRTRFVGRGGRVLATSTASDAHYAPRGDEGYVRAVVERDDGAKAWTQPVMLGR